MAWDRAGDIEIGLGLAQGLSGRQIAEIVRDKYPHIGATRNGVIGRVHRKGGANLIALAQQEAPERCAEAKPARKRIPHGGGRLGETKKLPVASLVPVAKPKPPKIRKAPPVRPHRGHVSDAPAEALAKAHGRFEAAFQRGEAQAPGARMVPIYDLEFGDCRWPHGDGESEPFLFCGAPQERKGELPYCAGHNRLAYNGTASSLTPEQRAGLHARAAGRPKRSGISFRIVA